MSPVIEDDHATPDADSWGREPSNQQLHLLVIGEDSFAKHPLPPRGRVRIGRGEDSDIRIEHTLISREHAILHIGDSIELEDLGSRNGTTMFGERLTAGSRRTVLPGQAIELGSTMIIIQRNAPQPALRRFATHEAYRIALEKFCAQTREKGAQFSIMRVRAQEAIEPRRLDALMRPMIGESDLAAVYAPGEYEVLLAADAGTRAEVLRSALERELGSKIHIGIALFPRDGRTPDALLDSVAARALGRDREDEPSSEGAIVLDPAMRDLYRVAERIAKGTISVLILGESGVGKEIFAEAIHRSSLRREGPLVRINCAALTDTLLESELFGHEKGAFTGAVSAKRGLLEVADGGTVLLDEIGEIAAAMQAKLLRVIEQRQLLRVGGVEPRAIDVRFLSATNRDLETEAARGTFRRDLFFRLSGVSLTIPPLRERTEEIEPLARRFIANACRDLGYASVLGISERAIDLLESYAWPGNIRELRNAIERAVLLCSAEQIGPEHLPFERMGASWKPESAPLETSEEEKRIRAALDACAGNQTRAAKMLGLTRRMLTLRLDKYGVPRPKKGKPD